MTSFLKPTVGAMVVALLVATAEATSYIPATTATRDFLFSPIFLWVAANAIILWLILSSSRRGKTNDDHHASLPAASHDGEVAVHDAVVDGLYTSSSEYEAFSDAGSAASHRRAFHDAPVSRREARAAARRADRPRVRKKPSPRAVAAAAAAAREVAGDEILRRREETPSVAVAGDEEEEDVSMDSLWESIVQRRAARPVVVRKSESWGNEELPRLQRVAETAAATRRGEMRKSVSAVSNSNKAAAEAAEATQQQQQQQEAEQKVGWRRRDVLVGITPDELLRRAESFIRRQHEHLRLQRQESEQRQIQLQRRLEASPALIRV